MLIAIDSNYFYAGIIVENNICVKAAPIIKWMIGKDEKYLQDYCRRKSWKTHIADYK